MRYFPMPNSVITEIEREFAQLSAEVQLSLLERLTLRVHGAILPSADSWNADISAMAADPAIQKELNRITSDFSATEMDGLS
jgi:hypothetical protein